MNTCGAFPTWAETLVHLAGLGICYDYTKQSHPELLYHVFFELNKDIFYNVNDIQTRLIPLVIPLSFSSNSKRWVEISVQLFRLKFFI